MIFTIQFIKVKLKKFAIFPKCIQKNNYLIILILKIK